MARSLIRVNGPLVVEGGNLHERIYRQLRWAIMAGHHLPGEVLTLRSLAAALGTSIIPVRDAVLRLIAERALVRVGRNIRLPLMTFEEFRDVLRFREALEGEAVMLAAERATQIEIQGIRAANMRLLKVQKQGNLQAILDANQQFHFKLYESAHNELLQTMIETLWMQIGPHLGLLLRNNAGGSVAAIDLTAHRELIAAIEARDGVAARTALIADLEDSIDVFRPFSRRNELATA